MKKTRKAFSIVLSIVMVLSVISVFGVTTSAANTPFKPYDFKIENGTISMKIDSESNSDTRSNSYYFECCRFDLFMIASDSPTGLDPASNKDYNYVIVVRNDGYPTATDGAGVTKDGLTFTVTLNTSIINNIKNYSAENPYVWLVIRPCSLANGLDNAFDENQNSMGFYHNKAASCAYFDSAVCLGKYDSIEDFHGVEPVLESGVIDVNYTAAKTNNNTYDVTVVGRPNMVQFMELDHGDGTGTRSFDRHHDSVTIVSYDAAGNIVADTSKDLAYEIWTITTPLAEGNIGVRVKEAGSPYWEDVSDAYSFVNEYAELDSGVISATLAKTNGKKGSVKIAVVAGADTKIVQLKNKEGETFTLGLEKATANSDGTLTFNGSVYFHGTDGTVNIATIRVNDAYGWHASDITVQYTIGDRALPR